MLSTNATLLLNFTSAFAHRVMSFVERLEVSLKRPILSNVPERIM